MAIDQGDFERLMRESTAPAMAMVLQQLPQMPPAHVVFYLNQLANLSIQLLRAGGKQDDDVRRFLLDALTSLERPPLLFLPDTRVH